MKKGNVSYYFWGIVSLVVVLSACSATGEVNAQSSGLWDRYIVYYFAEAIKMLSFWQCWDWDHSIYSDHSD